MVGLGHAGARRSRSPCSLRIAHRGRLPVGSARFCSHRGPSAASMPRDAYPVGAARRTGDAGAVAPNAHQRLIAPLPRADGCGPLAVGGDQVDQSDGRRCGHILAWIPSDRLDSPRRHRDPARLDQGSQQSVRLIGACECGQQQPRIGGECGLLLIRQAADGADHPGGPLASMRDRQQVGVALPATARRAGEQAGEFDVPMRSDRNG